ncbi:MAG: hypothetical protein M1820_010063 [Bogoriella megaspora]|nr:MAG: hypothetical protein M1820_010063 [Bogoriella megaspora]
MGTLTADTPRLEAYCDHKLPTSCRLTATPQCCACADLRTHATSYSTYIDGVGFVMRANRWQRYCWFCKEFWANRVAASGVRPADTRIPEIPDQQEFLDRWYEFHRGYRVVKREDGSEQRVAVVGEPLKDVAPGRLPRTLHELRHGTSASQSSYVQSTDNSVQRNHGNNFDAEPAQSLDAALSQLLSEAEAEEGEHSGTQMQPPPNNRIAIPTSDIAQTLSNTHHQSRRVAALRRELNRMRNGIERVISGLRELGEDVESGRANELAQLGQRLNNTSVDQGESISSAETAPVTAGDNRYTHTHGPLADLQGRLDQARTQLEEARRSREQASEELEAAESEVQSSRDRVRTLEREQRTAENYIRIFGTREEMERAGAEYESPIGGMFNRAWNRYRVAEEVRREERNIREVLQGEEQVLEVSGPLQTPIPNLTLDENASETDVDQNTLDEGVLRDYYTTLRMQDGTQGALSDLATVLQNARQSRAHSSQLRERIQQFRIRSAQLREQVEQAAQQQPPSTTEENSSLPRAAARRAWLHRASQQYGVVVEDDSSDTDQDRPSGLDQGDDGRPEPKSDEQMTIKLECKICYQQLADTVKKGKAEGESELILVPTVKIYRS